ncbi:MAG TPA: GTP-binding protein, partial [Xanthobacteraceae bacterium]|nr:GTP-binding protein [Xanthobacteraceae bacterium]
NEFGAAGIDDALLRGSADETVLLGNGCLCCNVRTDLQVALRGLVADRDRGVIPHFGRVVIETSGLADPGPILTTFATDRALGGAFCVECVLVAVDAATGIDTLEKFAEARRQAILADLLVLTKTDLVAGDAVAQLQTRLRALNPRAEIVTAQHGALDPMHFVASRPGAAEAAGFVAEAAHSDGVQSFVRTEEAPIEWETFERTMQTLLAMRGPDLLRIKGLLNVAGARGPVAVQFVQHLAHPPVELDRWPDADRSSRLVFITRGVSERQVADLFAAIRALA